MNCTSTHHARSLLLAIAATAATSALYAATPVAVWDFAAPGMALDTAQDGFTINVGYNNSIANGKISISPSGDAMCSGCSITLPADVSDVSVLVKFSNFKKQTGHSTYYPVFMAVRDSLNYELGVRSCDDGTSFTNYWYQMGSDGWVDGALKQKTGGEVASFSFCDSDGNVKVPSGYALFSYSATRGLHLSIGKDVKSLAGNTNTVYHFSNNTVKNIAIGGAATISFNDGWVGLVIEKVALFTGEYLFPSDVSSFEFPVVPASEINERFGSQAEISLSLPDGTTVDGDVAFSASKINFSSAGSIAVKPPAGNATIFDFTGVTGKPAILYEGALPTQSGSTTFTATTFPDFVTNSTHWTGTIWLRNIAVTDFNVNPYGNASSTVRLTGIRGWLRAPSNDTYLNSVPVELSDAGSNNGYALLINNGNSANSVSPLRCTAFVKISGDGTLADDTSAYPVVKVFDFSQFAGSINLDRVSLLVCDAATQYGSFYEMFGDGSEMASLIIESGKSAMIAKGKTWAVKNIRSHGPLTASAGTNLNSPRSAVFDGTLNFTTSETDFESLVLFQNVGRKPTAAFSKQTLDSLTINGEAYNKTFYFARLYGGNLIIKKRSRGFLYRIR